MAELVGQLLFALIRSIIWGLVDSAILGTARKIFLYLAPMLPGRAAVVFGLLMGVAAWAFLPVVVPWLLR